jgi:hypothetical protein
MPKLKREHQIFIVTSLACFDTPSEVVAAVKDTFGIDVDRGQVWTYDASKPHLRTRLSDELLEIFDTTREAFRNDVTGIAIANKSVRLRELQKLYETAKDRGAVVVAAEILEQAAKETGGAFTNRRELSGPGGGPIKTETSNHDLSKLSEEQLAELERLLVAAEPAPS